MMGIPGGVQDGQHIRCPYCGSRTGYDQAANLLYPLSHEGEAQNRAERSQGEGGTRGHLQRIPSISEIVRLETARGQKNPFRPETPEEKPRTNHAKPRRRSGGRLRFHAISLQPLNRLFVHVILAVAVIALAFVVCNAYFGHHGERAAWLEARNAVATAISNGSRRLCEQHDRYSVAVKDGRIRMRRSDCTEEQKIMLSRKMREMEGVQIAIRELNRHFSYISTRLDEMSEYDLRRAHADVGQRIAVVDREIEKCGSDLPQFTEGVAKPIGDKCSARDSHAHDESVRPTLPIDENTRLLRKIDDMIKKLQHAHYSFDLQDIKSRSLQEQYDMLVEMVYDVEMMQKKATEE